MKNYIIKNIQWDTDGEEVDLPNDVIVLDVREQEEYEVSKLNPKCILMNPNASSEQVFAKLNQLNAIPEGADVTVVCYCSIGYRSSRLADRLSDQVKAYNLSGGIFQWANEGRCVANAQDESVAPGISGVHPYNKVFGTMLASDLHKYPKSKGVFSSCDVQ